MTDLREKLPFDYLAKTATMMKRKRVKAYSKSYVCKVASGAIENADVMDCLLLVAKDYQKKRSRILKSVRNLKRKSVPVRLVVMSVPKNKAK